MNATHPKVSVLMLTYNHEKYIDEAIRSVMRQRTTFPFEVVIGNDASTDRTGEICRQWKARYPEQIVLIDREKNIGLQQNFLHTYSLCRGEYIAICEGDDYWLSKHKLQRQCTYLDEHNEYSCCFHRVVNLYEGTGIKSLSNGGQRINTNILDLAQSNYVSNVSAVFRNRLIYPLPEWFSEVSTYDYPLHLLNAQYGKLHYMRRPMAVYRQHEKAIWSKAAAEKKREISLSVRRLLISYFHEKKRLDVCERLQRACLAIQQHGQAEELTPSERARKQFRQVLKKAREIVSRLIPVPHFRGNSL